MMRSPGTAPEQTCLLIADISGYTQYLAGVELDHAQDVLADLMNVVVGTLHPDFRLAKLEPVLPCWRRVWRPRSRT